MKILPRLQRSLIDHYVGKPDFCTTDYGSWLTKAIYQFEYIELGQLLSEMIPLLEGETFHISADYDGHNAFEDFVCDILTQLFEKNGVISVVHGRTSIDVKKLEALTS